MPIISFPKWFPFKEIKHLFDILNQHGEARLVGGCVRDLILNRKNQDIDIASTLLPEQAIEILSKHSIRSLTTGIKHGTITAILPSNIICEITTLRKDISCDGRRAKVEYTDQWQDDALRRDFTINAMSLDLSGNLYDYFDGQTDLQHHFLRFVGDPEQRIQEDYLRILRYFRFYAYLGGDKIHTPSLNAAVTNASYIPNLSGERIRMEMMKLFVSEYAKESMLLMIKNEVSNYICLKDLDLSIIQDFEFSDEAIVNLAAILHYHNKPVQYLEELSTRWRLSNKEKKTLNMLCFPSIRFSIDDDEHLHKQYIYILGKEHYLQSIKLKNMKCPHNISYIKKVELAETVQIPTFPLTGHDLKKIGLSGKNIGQAMNIAKKHWIQSNFNVRKKELLYYLQHLRNSHE